VSSPIGADAPAIETAVTIGTSSSRKRSPCVEGGSSQAASRVGRVVTRHTCMAVAVGHVKTRPALHDDTLAHELQVNRLIGIRAGNDAEWQHGSIDDPPEEETCRAAEDTVRNDFRPQP
jgi:hypothetical protein